MATVGSTVITLADWAKRMDPNGRPARIIEMLSQKNEILLDMRFKMGNLPTGERTTQRTGLPTVYWRLLNQGVPTSKSRTAQIDAHCGIMEARSQVDVDLASLAEDVGLFRLNEAQPFIEAMNIEAASTLFYGTAASPEEFIGLNAHYSAISGANNAQNIIDAGGTGSDNSSMWLIVWGEQTIHGIFPKGSEAGLKHVDMGIQDVKDSDGNEFRAYKDWFQWKIGVVVKDWRFAVRICNIDISELIAESASAADIINCMIRANHRIPSLQAGSAAWYCNRTIAQMLDIQANKKTNVYLQPGMEEGGPKVRFRGIPIRTCDALTEAEARVT